MCLKQVLESKNRFCIFTICFYGSLLSCQTRIKEICLLNHLTLDKSNFTFRKNTHKRYISTRTFGPINKKNFVLTGLILVFEFLIDQFGSKKNRHKIDVQLRSEALACRPDYFTFSVISK